MQVYARTRCLSRMAVEIERDVLLICVIIKIEIFKTIIFSFLRKAYGKVCVQLEVSVSFKDNCFYMKLY